LSAPKIALSGYSCAATKLAGSEVSATTSYATPPPANVLGVIETGVSPIAARFDEIAVGDGGVDEIAPDTLGATNGRPVPGIAKPAAAGRPSAAESSRNEPAIRSASHSPRTSVVTGAAVEFSLLGMVIFSQLVDGLSATPGSLEIAID
jgi:hypothetical protein